MNVEDVFSCLVKNKYMPDFDYVQNTFSFQTVFYQSATSYCCCPCSFIFEYTDYISESGDINTELYQQIITFVINGKCMHVDSASQKFLRTTRINAIHIAAAVGTDQAMEDYFYDYQYVHTAIFQLSPFWNALIRSNTSIIEMAENAMAAAEPDLRPGKHKVQYAYITTDQPNLLKIEYVSISTYCIQHKKEHLLKSLLKHFVEDVYIGEALRLAFAHNLCDIQADICEYLQSLYKNGGEAAVLDCAVSAIIYDYPDILNNVLKILYTSNDDEDLACDFDDFVVMFETCRVLKRSACAKILKQYDQRKPLRKDPLKKVVSILLKKASVDRGAEIQNALKSIPEVIELVNNSYKRYREPWLHYYASKNALTSTVIHVIKELLELGADVDKLDCVGHTPVERLLTDRNTIKGYQEALKLLLDENPNVNLNTTAVREAIQLDEHFEQNTCFRDDMNVQFVTDVKEHPLFGLKESEDIALNFLGPFLIECGFPVTREDLESALDKPLHTAEHAYIRRCLEEPRPLNLCCRDVLRKHFKRRHLHQFIESLGIPKPIKDFILLRTMYTNNA